MSTTVFSRRTVLAWAFYDFANSAYALLISGVAYQVYFKRVVFAGNPGSADFAWAVAVSGSIFVSAVLSPVLGAAADLYGWRLSLFRALTIGSVLFTSSLALVGPYQTVRGIVLFALANLSYNLVLLFYDSYLQIVAQSNRVSTVSGLGWGLGYVGGIVCLAVTFPLFGIQPEISETTFFRIGFVAVAAFYLVFSIPALLTLPRDSMRLNRKGMLQVITASLARVRATLAEWRNHKDFFKFLLAFYCITEAIMTTIYFMANYLSSTFGLETGEILILTVVVQLIGFPASWAAGYFADRWNLKRAFLISLGIWSVIVVVIAAASTRVALYLISALMGLVIGSTQALGRAYLSNLSPSGQLVEFFGFNSLSSKIAATLGPLLFGIVSSVSGSQRLAWLSLLPFLLAGGVLILSIRRVEDVKKNNSVQDITG